MPIKTSQLRDELMAQILRAEKRGAEHIEINSGELHRAVGEYPGEKHNMPGCCRVMYDEQDVADKVLSRPPGGAGASLTIRYKLPRPKA